MAPRQLSWGGVLGKVNVNNGIYNWGLTNKTKFKIAWYEEVGPIGTNTIYKLNLDSE